MFIYKNMYADIFICIYICTVYVHIHVYLFLYTYICVCTCVYISIYIYTYIYIYIYICIYRIYYILFVHIRSTYIYEGDCTLGFWQAQERACQMGLRPSCLRSLDSGLSGPSSQRGVLN